jgi:hypothetical protein
VNNIDGRQSMGGVPAHYAVSVAYAAVWWSVVVGGAPAAVWLLLALSRALWGKSLDYDSATIISGVDNHDGQIPVRIGTTYVTEMADFLVLMASMSP